MCNHNSSTEDDQHGPKNSWIIFVIPVTILSLGLGLYWRNFGSTPFSDSSQAWGGYGSYMTSFVNLCNLCVVIYFSYQVYLYNRRKDREANLRDAESKKREAEFKTFQKELQYPVLSFRTIAKNGNEQWQVFNVGNGPALNLKVAYQGNSGGRWEPQLVKCYSLGKGDFVDLEWFLSGPDLIGVCYSDIFGRQYVSLVGNDISESRSFDQPFVPIIIDQQTFDKAFFDGMLALPPIRLTAIRNKKTSSTTTTETTHKP